MKEVKKGMSAVSMAGHDTGKIYIIIRAEKEYAYLTDGDLRPLERPKKKKWKHIQVNCHISPEIETVIEDGGELQNETIKRVIKEYRSKQEV